jgi:hypothetical protein
VTEYVIEIPHAPDECPSKTGADSLFRWTIYDGCASGAHTSWTIADLASEDEAWRLVPELLRDTARVVAVHRRKPAERKE